MERLAEIRDLLATRRAELTDDEIAALEAELVELANEQLDLPQTDDTLAVLEEVAAVLGEVRDEQGARAVAAETRAARAAELAAQINGPAAEADPEPVADEVDEPVADESADAGDREPEVVTAAAPPAAPAAAPTRVSRVNARRPQSMSVRPQATPSAFASDNVGDWGLTASANVPEFTAGAPIRNEQDLFKVWEAAIRSTRGYRGPDAPLAVVRAGADPQKMYGRDRFLGRDPQLNEQRIQAITSQQAITASGGTCAPSPVMYDVPVIGSQARPVRDQFLTRFGADRGGVTLMAVPKLSDIPAAAVGLWTAANDTNVGSDGAATKSYATITCPSSVTTEVDAIFQSIKFGNYRARFWPEIIAGWTQLVGVAHARFAERRLLARVATLSTAVTTGTNLGTARDVLASLDRAAAGMRNRHRVPGMPLKFAAPSWLLDNIRTDLAREAPGSADERLAVADAKIESFFAVRKVMPVWIFDGEAGQDFGAQAAGVLDNWPTNVIVYLAPEGSLLHLDGGEFNLGIFRDSTLVDTNDVRSFSETFENVAFHGVEALKITMDICPDGSTSASVDINPCSTGS